MKTPVIIPAYNAEAHLGATLQSLPADLVRPVVAVNGSNDQTIDVARNAAEHFGNELVVLDFEEQGKLYAIQQTLKHLGKEALEPLIILDSDTRPIRARRWHNTMLDILTEAGQEERPQAVGGPVLYSSRDVLQGVLRSGYRIKRARNLGTDASADAIADDRGPGRSAQYGPSMGFYIKKPAILDAIEALPPDKWPGEDREMTLQLVKDGGRLSQPTNLDAFVWSPLSESYPPLWRIALMGRSRSQQVIHQAYANRAPVIRQSNTA